MVLPRKMVRIACHQFMPPSIRELASVWCAVSPQLEGKGGVYCEDCDVAEAVPADSPAPRGVRPYATDPELAERLWTLSERLTGVRFAP